MTRIRANAVAPLVATAKRRELLRRRALPSISAQSRPPDIAIVVDDSGDNSAVAETEKIVREWSLPGIKTSSLKNPPTRGASGAWNSGLDHLLRMCRAAEQVFVPILDDDDCWDPRHLESCLALAEHRSLDMVAAPFQRIEEQSGSILVEPSESLRVGSFLVGIPGIQASQGQFLFEPPTGPVLVQPIDRKPIFDRLSRI